MGVRMTERKLMFASVCKIFDDNFIWLIVYEICVWEALEAFVGSAAGMCPNEARAPLLALYIVETGCEVGCFRNERE
ncbi:hypothetical protein ABIA27_001333 [Sinorhizobium fredii]